MHFTSYNLASEKITRLSYMVSDIANAIESGQTIMGIFLDLSKAFDTINHNILLSKLCHYVLRSAPEMFQGLTRRKLRILF